MSAISRTLSLSCSVRTSCVVAVCWCDRSWRRRWRRQTSPMSIRRLSPSSTARCQRYMGPFPIVTSDWLACRWVSCCWSVSCDSSSAPIGVMTRLSVLPARVYWRISLTNRYLWPDGAVLDDKLSWQLDFIPAGCSWDSCIGTSHTFARATYRWLCGGRRLLCK